MEEQVQAEQPVAPKSANKTALLVLLIVLLLISNIATAYFLLTKKEVEQTDETAVEEESLIPINDDIFLEEEVERDIDVPELQTAVIGESIDLGDYSVSVIQVLDPNEDAPNTPQDGYRYVAIEILLENKIDETAYYSSDWTIYDEDGYDYSTYGYDYKTPSLSRSGNISVNGTVKGWLNYRVVEDAVISNIKFNEDFNNYSVEFVLEENEN